MKCANEKCDKNPMDSMDAISVNIDGDFACNEDCKKEYEKQRNEFFENIGNDEWYDNWLNTK
jgi:hypothetical protein